MNERPRGWAGCPPEIHHLFRSLLDFHDLVNLSLVDKDNAVECKAIMKERVTRGLTTFHLPAIKILEAMKEYKAHISGSFALSVLFPPSISFVPGDIDFYVRAPDAAAFKSRILDETEYTEEPTLLNTTLDVWYFRRPSLGVDTVTWLMHRVTKQRIKIISLAGDSHPIRHIFRSYSTLLMNVVTFAGVGCTYPTLTFKRVGVTTWSSGYYQARMSYLAVKYSKRKFKLAGSWIESTVQKALEGHDCETDRCCPLATRDLRSKMGMEWMMFADQLDADLDDVLPTGTWQNA